MQKNYKFLIAAFLCFFVFCPQTATAQLPPFTLTVTPHHEQCPANGSLEFTVSDTQPGSSVLYNVYKLPNLTTPIATLAANTLGGLTAGDYRVIATQTLAGETSTQQQDATILFTHVDIAFGFQLLSCGGNSTLTINVMQGTGVLYEILAGPVTFPPQASNVFTGLPDGSYQIRVYDICGAAYSSPYILTSTPGNFTIAPGIIPTGPLPSCNTVGVANAISALPGNTIKYPLSLQYTVYPPTGPPVVINTQINVGSPLNVTAQTPIPFFHGQEYQYDLDVTDACGNVFSLTNIIQESISVTVSESPNECFFALVVVPSIYVGPYEITFLSAPDGFDPSLFNGDHPGPFMTPASYYSDSVPVPSGEYTVSITDSCGNTAIVTTEYDPEYEVLPLSFSTVPGCEIGFGSVNASSGNGDLVSVTITDAPDAFTAELPYDVSFHISAGSFFMNSFPAGTYEFHSVDECGNVRDTEITIPGYQFNFSAEVTEACSTFDLMIHFASNVSTLRQYFLQKYDPVSDTWGHPGTGFVGGAVPNGDSAIPLLNNIMNPNIPYQGTFRVMLVFDSLGNGTAIPVKCVQELYTFEFNSTLSIDSIASFSCNPTTYDVVVNATGTAPLLYRITSKDGVPFVVENGTSNIFTGLEPAVYVFEVEDPCGNLTNRAYDTTEPFTYVVSATGFCDGQLGALSVPAFSFLNYEWWHESDPTSILSTSPVLEFDPLDVSTDLGTYHVRIFADGNTPSCIDFTISYTITSEGTLPDAGEDVTTVFCQNPGTVELFSLLDDATDTSGQWQDMTTGTILGSTVWNAAAFTSGTFAFEYTVNGWCGNTDTATIEIVLSAVPVAPVASADAVACSNAEFQLYADGAITYQYQWTGPNGFTSTEQNPVIDNLTADHSGTYSVIAISNGCESEPSSVEVLVGSVVPFTVSGGCEDNEYVLTATPSDAPFSDGTVFSWTGPDGFNSTQNPVTISGQPSGIYTFTATSADGCISSQNLSVGGTACSIPNGISPNGDGANDTFDLSGLHITELKILNRYGMVVYEKLNYLDEWDGRDYNGNELPTATYFYVAAFETGEKRTGWVYLIR